VTTATTDTRHPTLRYLPGLDGLRAISVLAVIVFHHYLVGGHEVGWAPGGFLGVEVFFVVSGYLITSLLLNERRETGRVSMKAFYLRRARRLLPALYLLLAVVIAWSLLFVPDAIPMLRGDVIAALTYTSNWWQIVSHHSYFIESGRPEVLKHLWSLAIEEQFYLAWPFLLMLGLRRLGRERMLVTIIGVALASTLLLALLAHGNIDDAYYNTFSRLSGLLLGSALAFPYAPYRIRGVPGPGVRVALNVAGAFGLFLLLASFGVLHRFGINGFLFPSSQRDNLSVFNGGFLFVDLATLLVILAAVHPASDVGRALGCKPLRWIGLRSYGLYLWHYPIFCVTRPGLDIHRVGIWFLSFKYAGWPVFVIRLVLSFAAAELSYRYVETPIRSGAIGRYRTVIRTAAGEHRQRLARRGVVIGGGITAAALLLGTGLATAQTPAVSIPGITDTGNQNGGTLDPSALQVLRQTPTTRVATTPTTRGTSSPGHPKTTTTTAPKPTSGVLGIGDSVMQGAESTLQSTIPGMAVDAARSRQFYQGIDVVQQYASLHALPTTLVIGLGTNGRITDQLFDQMMNTIGPGHQVYFLTARVPRPWEAEDNAALHNGATRWKNAHVLEWRAYSGCHDDWFVSDGFHLRTPGQHAYADFVRLGLIGRAPRTCTP
jgi:peptidoglycan/LPS O-acetylase OafA/YrhL